MHKVVVSRLVLIVMLLGGLTPFASAQSSSSEKVGPIVRQRMALSSGRSRVIIQAADAASLNAVLPALARANATLGRRLPIINGQVLDVPNVALAGIANNPLIAHIALDRPALGTLERTGGTIGSTAVRQQLGYDGSGIGVAVIDSGVTPWHDDLSGGGGAQRVAGFVDFVNGRTVAYDDVGHGTHVA